MQMYNFFEIISLCIERICFPLEESCHFLLAKESFSMIEHYDSTCGSAPSHCASQCNVAGELLLQGHHSNSICPAVKPVTWDIMSVAMPISLILRAVFSFS